jgi:hypothetical protein
VVRRPGRGARLARVLFAVVTPLTSQDEQDPPITPGRSARASLRVVGLTAATLAVVCAVGGAIGEQLPAAVVTVLGIGAVGAFYRPRWRVGWACGSGLVALALVNPVFCAYFAVLVGALTISRLRTRLFVAVLITAAIVAPKTAFSLRYHQPGYWNWFNEPSLTLALLVSAMWIRARRQATRDRTASPPQDSLSFVLNYLFPSHATNPLPYSPGLLARDRRLDERAIVTLLGWFVAKSLALVGLRTLGPPGFLRHLLPTDLGALGWLELWGLVIGSYLETYLSLAATADIPVLMGRLFGFQLPDPFRFALLAWNPVELWRRWGIYNRHVLLQLVYLPLGGAGRRKYLNVLLTFLASALLLHSGWFGSKYWHVGIAGWRDQSVYFLLQGLAVCACLALWDRTGKSRAKAGPPRLSFAIVAASLGTQAWSALAHVVILAPNVQLADRARLVARCLGIV